MNYGKIENGNLKYLKMPLKIGDRDVFTNDKNIILEQGYKPIEFTNPEETKDWLTPICSFEEEDNKIVQKWNYSSEV